MRLVLYDSSFPHDYPEDLAAGQDPVQDIAKHGWKTGGTEVSLIGELFQHDERDFLAVHERHAVSHEPVGGDVGCDTGLIPPDRLKLIGLVGSPHEVRAMPFAIGLEVGLDVRKFVSLHCRSCNDA